MKFLDTYKDIESDVKHLLWAGFYLQLTNAAFFLILNIFMVKEGYTDPEIATFTSYRFAAVMLFAIPFGLFIKGKRLKPMLLYAALSIPILSWLILEAIDYHQDTLLIFLFLTWGVSFSISFITSVPFILRNAHPNTHTPAISLRAATWSGGFVLMGISFFLLSAIDKTFFDEKLLLQISCLLTGLAIYHTLKISSNEIVEKKTTNNRDNFYQYDWPLIGRAALPVLTIAIGAGLTIPFMNLFFYHIFGMDGDIFSLLGSVTSVFVFLSMLLVPRIKKRFGYEAIVNTQTAAIIALFLLGTTDFLSHYSFAIFLAAFCYMARQPLMRIANPLSTEMTMYYVGKKNQELMSALTSSIWSGSWFISTQIFALLRSMNLRYGYIIYITASLYVVGALMFYWLLRHYRKREKLGLIVID